MYHIFWHKNPDTDAVLSAIVAKEYFFAMGQEAQAYRLGELNKETAYILKSVWVESPPLLESLEAGSEVVLVDHNAPAQSFSWLENLSIACIIDHHAVESLSTKTPIQLRFDPVCSTCSILFLMFAEQDLEIPDHVAKLILAGILSDSLAFRSPTTTDEDREIAEYLAEDLGITDIQAFAKAMFDAKSDIHDLPIRTIVTQDFKEYTVRDKRFAYGVHETTNPTSVLARKQEIIADLRTLKEESDLHAVFFSVVDIMTEKNITFVISDIEKNALKWAFSVETVDEVADLGKRLSRKKELEPAIRAYFEIV